MPLEFLRFAPTGPRDPRETAQKCNQLGEAAARQIAALEGRLDLLENIIVDLRVAAQGSMELQTPVAGPDITATYQPITFFDTIPYERGVTVNTTTGEFTVNLEGDWAFWYRLNIAVAASGTRRTLSIRSFNVTTATPGTVTNLFIPSNAPDVSDTLMVPVAFAAAAIGQTLRLEIGNASNNITGVTWNDSSILLLYVGELGELIDPVP